jgi:hypothetical protein
MKMTNIRLFNEGYHLFTIQLYSYLHTYKNKMFNLKNNYYVAL